MTAYDTANENYQRQSYTYDQQMSQMYADVQWLKLTVQGLKATVQSQQMQIAALNTAVTEALGLIGQK